MNKLTYPCHVAAAAALRLQLRAFCTANEPAAKVTELLAEWLDELTTQQVSRNMLQGTRRQASGPSNPLLQAIALEP